MLCKIDKLLLNSETNTNKSTKKDEKKYIIKVESTTAMVTEACISEDSWSNDKNLYLAACKFWGTSDSRHSTSAKVYKQNFLGNIVLSSYMPYHYCPWPRN